MYELQKILWFLVLPPSSLVLLIGVGLVLLERHRRTGRGLIIAGLSLLYLLSLDPVADLLVKPLERGGLPDAGRKIDADAVIVPGGGSVDLEWLELESVPNGETTARLMKGIELSRRLRVPLVLTGGNGEPFSTKVNDADVMAASALAMGIPEGRMIVENESRNTLENSHAVRNLVRGDRIVLVTSAYYLRRARAMFEKRGFSVVPAPVYFLGQTRKWSVVSFIPRAGAFRTSAIAIAEWLSMAWWGLRGEM